MRPSELTHTSGDVVAPYPLPESGDRPPDRIGPLSLGALLQEVENASPVESVQVFADALAKRCGASEVALLLADADGRLLIRLGTEDHTGAPETLEIEGSPPGEALRTQEIELVSAGEGARVYAPVTARGEALGVLELLLPDTPDSSLLTELRALTHTLAYVIVADSRFTDFYDPGGGPARTSLAAEIQHQLLPRSYTCEASQFSLAGWLVPASSAGGDTFDYALSAEHLHLSITDAMGHGINAALLATLTVGSLRNSRRRRCGVVEQIERANRALLEDAESYQFVTGQVLRVKLATGAVEVVNAGHLSPFLLREGQLSEIKLSSDTVLGVLDHPYSLQHFALEPGDRLVLITDGMLERDAERADIPALLPTLSHLHPREAVQHCTRAVEDAGGGTLEDDATILILDWYGGPARPRESSEGASPSLASE